MEQEVPTMGMTASELYRYDLQGYLYLENAIPPALLKRLDERMDFWEERGRERLASQPDQPAVTIDDILNQDEAFLDLVANPRVLPYIDEMVSRPRLKSTWLALKWKGGAARDRSNHTPSNTCNFYHFNGGRIQHNLFQVFYAIRDVPPGGGGMRLIPGTHKANYPLPPDDDLADLEIEIPMKAGSVLLFTHDLHHTSLNTTDRVRRVVIFTYCPSVIANSYEPGDSLYDRLFERSPEGSWQKYLLRRPHGFRETYPKPANRPYEAG
jgi:hypothetical protein